MKLSLSFNEIGFIKYPILKLIVVPLAITYSLLFVGVRVTNIMFFSLSSHLNFSFKYYKGEHVKLFEVSTVISSGIMIWRIELASVSTLRVKVKTYSEL